MVVDVEAGQVVDPPRCRDESAAWHRPTRPPDRPGKARRRWGQDYGRAAPSLRPAPTGKFSSCLTLSSHLDCRRPPRT
jgi:hypothetical protein